MNKMFENVWTEIEDPWKDAYHGSLTVKDIMERCNVNRSKVIYWIEKGLLKAERANHVAARPYFIREEDFKKFLLKGEHAGNPKPLKDNQIFNRVPDVEDCFPINLIRVILDMNDDDTEGFDIWDINVKQFKNALIKLSDQEQRVISLRYRFGFTLAETGAAIQRTKERIRQIEAKALRKLKHMAKIQSYFLNVSKQEYITLKAQYQKVLVELDNLKNGNLVQEEKEQPIIDFLNTEIEYLDLSAKSYNCLRRASIKTIGDIMSYDQHQEKYHTWQNIRNLGKKSLREIARKTFEFCGYRLRQYDETEGKYIGTIPIFENEEIKTGIKYGGEMHD